MLVVGLVHDRGGGWQPPDGAPDPPEDPPPPPIWTTWRLPWRPLAWFAAWCWLMVLVPIVSRVVDPLAGYGVLMLATGLGFWRIERWCARQYWHGLREYKY